MMRDIYATLTADTIKNTPTLPAQLIFNCKQSVLQRPEVDINSIIDDTEITYHLCSTNSSSVFYCMRKNGEECIVKLVPKNKATEKALLSRVATVAARSQNLMPVYGVGAIGDYQYQVYPFYKDGSLKNAVIDEKDLREKVLPSICSAVVALHNSGVVHNDIKPENLFWSHGKKTVILGDYGCISRENTKEDVGCTLEFCAPEVLLSKGRNRSRKSDYCSIGLTVYALMTGTSLLGGKSLNELIRFWNMENVPLKGLTSPKLEFLVRGLIRKNAHQRMGINEMNSWLGKPAVEEIQNNSFRIEPFKMTKRNGAVVYIADIEQLTQELKEEWNFGVFLLDQKSRALARFLLQFDKKYVRLLEECCNIMDKDVALYKLLMQLKPCAEICWKGEVFSTLDDYKNALDPDKENNAYSFFASGLLRYYLESNGAKAVQLDFVRKLEKIAVSDKRNALLKLKTALGGENVFYYDGHRFTNINELCKWLLQQGDDIDRVIVELMESQLFRIWLELLGFDGMVKSINYALAGERDE